MQRNRIRKLCNNKNKYFSASSFDKIDSNLLNVCSYVNKFIVDIPPFDCYLFPNKTNFFFSKIVLITVSRLNSLELGPCDNCVIA